MKAGTDTMSAFSHAALSAKWIEWLCLLSCTSPISPGLMLLALLLFAVSLCSLCHSLLLAEILSPGCRGIN